MEDRGVLSATVVSPVYNRVALLENVIAGLARQTTDSPFDVVVVDDGSAENVADTVARSGGDMAVEVIRQERSRRARNRGAQASDADVLIFLDADCIPGPEYIETHVVHHRKAANVVVTASRRHIDRPVSTSELQVFDSLLSETGFTGLDQSRTVTPDDWRRVFYRRNHSLLLGDAAFRETLSGLMSVARSVFTDVGGFDEQFRQWGGEHTEFGWGLWNRGCYIIPENSVAVVHRRSEDLEEGGSRERRRDVLALVADRVPHRFHRKEPSHLYSVPKTSLVMTVTDASEADRAWQEATRASVSNTELIVVGGDDAVRTWVSATESRDFSVVDRFRDAIEHSREEFIAVIDGRSRFDRRLLARVLGRFDDAGTGAVRAGSYDAVIGADDGEAGAVTAARYYVYAADSGGTLVNAVSELLPTWHRSDREGVVRWDSRTGGYRVRADDHKVR